VNKTECCPAATLPLHVGANRRMYKGLTAKTPGCVAFSLPVQRRNLLIQEIPASFRSLHRPAQRAADKEGGFEPERRRSQVTILFQGRLQTRHNRLSGPQGPICDGRRALQRRAGLSATDKAAPFCRQRVPDGPTLDAPDCVADQDPPNNRADAERKLCASHCFAAIPFGVAPRVAFWPSPHPRIRWTVASPGGAIRAHGNTRPPPS